jgi:hypothetical protein
MSDLVTITIKRTVNEGAPYDESKGFAIGKVERVGSFSLSASALLSDGNKTRTEAMLMFEAFLTRVASDNNDS